jgi:two-component sensor histidine kinase
LVRLAPLASFFGICCFAREKEELYKSMCHRIKNCLNIITSEKEREKGKKKKKKKKIFF